MRKSEIQCGLLTLAFTTHTLRRRLCKPHRTNSLAHSSIGTPSPLTRLRLFVSIWFQVLFHLPLGMLFTFPSRYWFTIDHKKYLALGHSRPWFIRDFTSPALLKIKCWREIIFFVYGAITLSGRAFQLASTKNYFLWLFSVQSREQTHCLATSAEHMVLEPSGLAPASWIETAVRQI